MNQVKWFVWAAAITTAIAAMAVVFTTVVIRVGELGEQHAQAREFADQQRDDPWHTAERVVMLHAGQQVVVIALPARANNYVRRCERNPECEVVERTVR